MPRPYRPIKYKRNPPSAFPIIRLGQRVLDQQNGAITNKNYIVTDDYGTQVDYRWGTYDYDAQLTD